MNGTLESLLEKKRVLCLDSPTIIYFIEQNPRYLPLLRTIFGRIDSGILVGMSSYITLIEVLVKPLSIGRTDLAIEYRHRLTESTGFTLLPVEKTISERAAELRATHGLRIADAIQFATAMENGAEAFVTNDRHFDKVAGVIEVIRLDRLVAGGASPES